MEYDIINQVYEEIISIVNRYVRRTNCDYDVARKLSFALLGYYLVFGAGIFNKLNVLLDSVKIYQCSSKKEYSDTLIEIAPRIEKIKDELLFNPITIWDYKYDADNKFLGGIPYIFYMSDNEISDVLSLAHEMSHGLEGTSATVVKEDDETVCISQGFTKITVNKDSNSFTEDNSGFIEVVTSSLETRILRSFLKLDISKITSPLLREFLSEIAKYKSKNVMSSSYELMNSIFKDLTDNDEFYNLIKEFFYDNNEEGFKARYEAYGNGLYYNILKEAAAYLSKDGISASSAMYYRDIVARQAAKFNQVTGYEPDKKLLILV